MSARETPGKLPSVWNCAEFRINAVAFALVALWFSGCASTNGIAATTKADFQETTSAKPFSTIIKAVGLTKAQLDALVTVLTK